MSNNANKISDTLFLMSDKEARGTDRTLRDYLNSSCILRISFVYPSCILRVYMHERWCKVNAVFDN